MTKDYNQKIQFPTNDNYVCRINAAEFTPSKSSGNPMIHLTAEVVSPEVVEVGDDDVNIAGVEAEVYYTTTALAADGEQDAEKTDKARTRLETLCTNLKVDYKALDIENPDVNQFKGLVILCAMRGKVQEQRKAPTREQAAKGLKQGDVMMNPVTGQKLVFYRPEITEIFGLAPEGAATKATSNKPY